MIRRRLPSIFILNTCLLSAVSAYAEEPSVIDKATTTTTTSTTSSSTPKSTPTAVPAAQLKPDAALIYKNEFDQGSKLFQAKKYTQALSHFTKAAGSGHDEGEARIMVGYCHYQLRQYDQALKQYKQAANSAKLISISRRAQKLASTLDSYMKGICPGNCLKPSMPGWHKMDVPGKPARLVWMVFPYLDPAGKGGSEYWSNDHMGEVIEYVNGRPIDKGPCPICHGTTRVSLPK